MQHLSIKKWLVPLAALVALGLSQASFAQGNGRRQEMVVKPSTGELKSTDPQFQNRHYNIKSIKLVAGSKYVFEMVSQTFKARILLVNKTSRAIVGQSTLIQNRLARINYTPKANGEYIYVLTTQDEKKVGRFATMVYEDLPVIAKNPPTTGTNPPRTNVTTNLDRVHQGAKQVVASLQSVAKRNGKIALSQIGPFAQIFSAITIEAPQFDRYGSVTGTSSFGGKSGKILLQYLPPDGLGVGKWAFAVQLPGGSLSSVLSLPRILQQAVDQFDIRAPILVFSPEDTEIEYADLSDSAKVFYRSIYKTQQFSVRLKRGVNLLTAASFKRGSAMDTAMRKFGINITEVQLEGVVLKDFNFTDLRDAKKNGKLGKALLQGTSLRATIPSFRFGKLPRGWIAGGAYIEVTGQPSLSVGYSLKVPVQGSLQTFEAKLRLSKSSSGVEAAFVAIKDGRWYNAFGLTGLHLDRVALVLGLDSKLNLTLGMQAKFEVARKLIDIAGKFKVNLTTGVPTDIAFRVGSKDSPLSLGTREIVNFSNQLIRAANPRARTLNASSVPDFEIRKFYFSFAPQGGDSDLQIPDGIAFSGALYYQRRELASIAGEIDISSPFPKLKLKGRVADIDLKALKLKNASVDINITPSTDAYFKVKGSLTVLAFNQTVDVNISKTQLYFKLQQKLNGVFQTEYLISSGTTGYPYWRFEATMQQDLTKTLERSLISAAKSWRDKSKAAFDKANRDVRIAQANVNRLNTQIAVARRAAQAEYDRGQREIRDAEAKLRAAQRKLKPVKDEQDSAYRKYQASKKKRWLGIPHPEETYWAGRYAAAYTAYNAAKGTLQAAEAVVNSTRRSHGWITRGLGVDGHPNVVALKAALGTANAGLTVARGVLQGAEGASNAGSGAVEYIGQNVNNFFTINKISFKGVLGTTPRSLTQSRVTLTINYRWLGRAQSYTLTVRPNEITPNGLVNYMKRKLGIT